MRIVFVSPVGAFFSGAEVAISNLMSYLVTKGHQVYNVIPDNGFQKDQAYLDFMKDHGISLFEFPSQRWWWSEAHPLADHEKAGVFASQHQNIAQLRELLVAEQIDLVISNTINVFQGAIAAALEGLPHYQIIHEFPFGEFAYYKEKIPLIEGLSDKVFAVSGELYDELSQHFSAGKLFPFIPYTHLEVMDLEVSEKPRLVSLGGINPRKNQLELIKAYEILEKPDLDLVFIGGWDEAYKRELDAYIAEKNLKNISFLGHVTNPFQRIKSQDLMVFTSKMEAFPLVYTEALLAGVPTLVSETYGHETVKAFFEASNSYPLGDVKRLAEAINELLSDPQGQQNLARELGIKARERYTLEKTSQIFLDELSRPVYSPKTQILGLDRLLGWEVDQELIRELANQRVRIYHSHQVPYYQTDTYILKDEDRIEIPVGEADYIRIDMTQQSGFYPEFQVRNLADGSLLNPVHQTGLSMEQGILFLTKDPQVVYETSDLEGQTLVFTYRRSSLDQVGPEIKSGVERYDDLERRFQALSHQFDTLDHQFKTLNNQYQSVIHSRRWTIPTKLINFFRRSK